MLPPLLKQGDKIGVVAPARKISKEELIPFVNWCESNDWEVIYSKNLFAINNQFAGTDTQKVEDINSMLANPEIKAIFCARGGYGSARIVDKIDWSFLKQNPKWICGYSDITVLHQHIQNVLNQHRLRDKFHREQNAFKRFRLFKQLIRMRVTDNTVDGILVN